MRKDYALLSKKWFCLHICPCSIMLFLTCLPFILGYAMFGSNIGDYPIHYLPLTILLWAPICLSIALMYLVFGSPENWPNFI